MASFMHRDAKKEAAETSDNNQQMTSSLAQMLPRSYLASMTHETARQSQ